MRVILSFLFVAFFVDIVSAQDTHYWTHQYGTRSVLMGGAVVGGIKNNTAIFYNPASLGFIDTASLSINANAYQSENITVENALGEQKDFKSSYLASVPLLVGGMFRSGKEHKLKIAYGLVSPVDFSFNATARIDNYEEIVGDPESPGAEEFIAQSGISSKLKETIAAIGLGRRINEHWSIGLSNFFVVRTQQFSRTQYARAYLNDAANTLVSSSFVRNVSFYNVRYVAKLGITYEKENFSAGMSVSAPSLNFLGNGSIAVDLIGNNVKAGDERIDFLGNDRQEKLKSTYKSPFTISAGTNWSLKRSAFGVAVQYFGKTEVYDVMQAKASAFVRPANLYEDLSSDQYLRLKSGARSVINAVIGYEYKLKETVSLIASFRTDNSFFDPKVKDAIGLKSEITTWDIYHFTGGVTLTKGKSQLSLGLLFSTGADANKREDGNLDNPSEDNFLQGSTTIVKAKYSSIGLLIGYSFSFKKF